jgi:hypothetical protein
MKKITSVLCLILFVAVAAHAQDFKKFRVGVGGGYAMPGGEGAKGGVCFYLEPGYRVNDALIVGLRMESAVVVRGFSEDIGSADLDIAGIGSYTLNGQYYFSNEGFRPFAGLGFGMYSLAAVKFDDGGATETAVQSESKFGFYPRVGFDARHFTLQIEYNLIPATEYAGGEFKNSYLGIKVGGFFGGGRK